MISFYTDNFSHTITILQYKKSHLLVNDIGDHKQKEITHFFHIATIASEYGIRSPSDTGDTTVKPAFILGLGPFPTQTNANIDIEVGIVNPRAPFVRISGRVLLTTPGQ